MHPLHVLTRAPSCHFSCTLLACPPGPEALGTYCCCSCCFSWCKLAGAPWALPGPMHHAAVKYTLSGPVHGLGRRNTAWRISTCRRQQLPTPSAHGLWAQAKPHAALAISSHSLKKFFLFGRHIRPALDCCQHEKGLPAGRLQVRMSYHLKGLCQGSAASGVSRPCRSWGRSHTPLSIPLFVMLPSLWTAGGQVSLSCPSMYCSSKSALCKHDAGCIQNPSGMSAYNMRPHLSSDAAMGAQLQGQCRHGWMVQQP